jgi:hypothetical protein
MHGLFTLAKTPVANDKFPLGVYHPLDKTCGGWESPNRHKFRTGLIFLVLQPAYIRRAFKRVSTAARAAETGQFTLVASASSRNWSSPIPGTSALHSSSIKVILDLPSTFPS